MDVLSGKRWGEGPGFVCVQPLTGSVGVWLGVCNIGRICASVKRFAGVGARGLRSDT